MIKHECIVCSYIYDDSIEEKPWNELDDDWLCPICGSGKVYYKEIETSKSQGEIAPKVEKITSIDYDSNFLRSQDDVEEHLEHIHTMAITGKSIVEPMRTKNHIISWDDILIKGAQLHKFPLNKNEEVSIKTIIGKNAKQALKLEMPIIVTHMSFGALSKEVKLSLAKGSAAVKTAMSSGEGGILEESLENSFKYIFEYVPNKYSVNDENLKKVDAIEVKIGQSAKPGMGGHLPKEKVTKEIAIIRGKKINDDIISPARFNEIKNQNDLKNLVESLRQITDGKPIGIKLAAGDIEGDLKIAVYANPDFITIDGRGGGTGASPKFVKDSTSIPTLFALYRAKQYLNKVNRTDIDIIITGGLRISSDFAKAIAMGADAVAIGTSLLIASACQQYKICNSGNCPVGCATQDETLRKRVKVEAAAKRVENFLKVSAEELRDFARLTGNEDIFYLNINDLCTTNSEISNHTNIKHV